MEQSISRALTKQRREARVATRESANHRAWWNGQRARRFATPVLHCSLILSLSCACCSASPRLSLGGSCVSLASAAADRCPRARLVPAMLDKLQSSARVLQQPSSSGPRFSRAAGTVDHSAVEGERGSTAAPARGASSDSWPRPPAAPGPVLLLRGLRAAAHARSLCCRRCAAHPRLPHSASATMSTAFDRYDFAGSDKWAEVERNLYFSTADPAERERILLKRKRKSANTAASTAQCGAAHCECVLSMSRSA